MGSCLPQRHKAWLAAQLWCTQSCNTARLQHKWNSSLSVVLEKGTRRESYKLESQLHERREGGREDTLMNVFCCARHLIIALITHAS